MGREEGDLRGGHGRERILVQTPAEIHACSMGREEGDLRGGHGRERMLVQTPAEKKKSLEISAMKPWGGGLSSLILVVPVENIRIF